MSDMTIVDHLEHPIAQSIRSLLGSREEREALNQMIIDDEENILQAIAADISLKMILTTDKEDLSKTLLAQMPANVPIVELSKRTGKKLFGGEKISRLFAIADIPLPVSIDSLLPLKRDLIFLDKLSISGNIGAIIRTSTALNAAAIVLLDGELLDTYDRRVIRASRGFLFKIPIININTTGLIEFCKKNKVKMLATTSHTPSLIEDVIEDDSQFAIILGSEKTGCSQELFDKADLKAKIPMNPEVESLNVSVAASIILYLRDLHHRQYQLKKSNK